MSKSKVTSAKLAKLASKVMRGYEPTRDEIESLAASVMTQREKDLEAKKEAEVVAPEPAPAPVEEAPVVEAPVEEPAVEEAPAEEAPKGFWRNLFRL